LIVIKFILGLENLNNKYITGLDYNGGSSFQSPVDVLSELAAKIFPVGWNPHGQYASLVKC
jgi:hypothetical protein